MAYDIDVPAPTASRSTSTTEVQRLQLIEDALNDADTRITAKTDDTTVDAHITDTADAHDASAVSIADAGAYFTGTDVEAALQELGAGGGGGGGTDLGWFDVTDVAYGATGDGSTDDTVAVQAAIDAAAAAGGGVVYFPKGVYVIGGALQDASGANAQLTLPSIDAVDSEQVTIELRGQFAPPPIMSVVGATPIPDGHTVIKGTLNAGAGGALLGGYGPVGTFENFTFVHLRIRDLTFRLPSNPVLSAINASKVTGLDLDNVVVDCGSYYVQGLTEPTTTTSYGIRCPANNNGAFSRLGAVNVVGFYTGYEFAEHTVGQQVAAWGCKQAAVFVSTNHPSSLSRFMAVHCTKVLVFTGDHVVRIDQLAVEHAASGWWVTTADIDDASNHAYGYVRWRVVLAGSGPDGTFTVGGASNLEVAAITAPVPLRQNTQTGSYTLVAADAGKVVEMNVAGANNLTVPPNSSVAWPVGTVIEVVQLGAGQTTVVAGSGVTIRTPLTLKAHGQYSTLALRKRATDEWVLSGDLATS